MFFNAMPIFLPFLFVFMLLTSCKNTNKDIFTSGSSVGSHTEENESDSTEQASTTNAGVIDVSAEKKGELSLPPINGRLSFSQMKSSIDSQYYSVWEEYKVGSPTYIWANRFVGSGWETAQIIGVSEQEISAAPQIAVDNEGNAVAVWIQVSKENSAASEIWGAYYDSESGWNSSEYIAGQQEGQLIAVNMPKIVMNGVGRAVVAWQQQEVIEGISPYDMRIDIWARPYSVNDGGWGGIKRIETDDIGNAKSVQMTAFNDGSVLAVWQQFDGARDNILANQYTLDEGWGHATLIESDNNGGMHSVQITSDHLGNATAAWVQEGITKVVWSNHYTSVSGWGMAEPIESSGSDYLGSVRIASEGSDGHTVAVWHSSDGVDSNILASRYTVDEKWSPIEIVNTKNSDSKISPRIASNEAGYSTVLWSQSDNSGYSLWSNTHTSNAGWGEAKQVESNVIGDYGIAQSDDSGRSMAIWVQDFQALKSSSFESNEFWGAPEKVSNTTPNP